MKQQTEKLLADAKESVDDEGVFSADQITALHRMVDLVASALAIETGPTRCATCEGIGLIYDQTVTKGDSKAIPCPSCGSIYDKVDHGQDTPKE